ncbi:MAG TPA: nucleotide exchange factor GrpE [Acidobacteriota bacterium]|nr:nucleotide exchange factor GrpE [Acidobacteriota bacterium]
MNDPEDDKKAEEIEYIPVKPGEEEGATKAGAPAGEPAAGPAPKEPPAAGTEEGRHLKARKRDAELRQFRKERDELKDQYLRAKAEMDNLRKRVEREKAEYTQFALSELLLELLGVLDNLERALGAADVSPDGKSFRDGIELIYRMYQGALFKRGVRPIEIKDKAFDPTVHHAMITEESEGVSEPEVSQELQKGYLLHSRLLRPALVKVVVPKKG